MMIYIFIKVLPPPFPVTLTVITTSEVYFS